MGRMGYLSALSVALVSTALAGSAFADADDFYPDGKAAFFHDVKMMSLPRTGGWGLQTTETRISSSTDVDNFVFNCTKANGAQGIVGDAQINFSSSLGDLDLQVYSTEGTLLGASYGTGDDEFVDLTAAARSTVVVKVYGYRGATGLYLLHIRCM